MGPKSGKRLTGKQREEKEWGDCQRRERGERVREKTGREGERVRKREEWLEKGAKEKKQGGDIP